jgi:hypothetical protein
VLSLRLSYSNNLQNQPQLQLNWGGPSFNSTPLVLPTIYVLPTSCKQCDEGIESHCNTKYSGQYWDNSTKYCLPCSPGTYSNSSGATTCDQCPLGLISGSGASHCDPCDAGSFPNITSNSCQLCPSGTEAEQIYTHLLGSTSSSGDLNCTLCSPGSYAPTPGSLGCGVSCLSL